MGLKMGEKEEDGGCKVGRKCGAEDGAEGPGWVGGKAGGGRSGGGKMGRGEGAECIGGKGGRRSRMGGWGALFLPVGLWGPFKNPPHPHFGFISPIFGGILSPKKGTGPL